MPPSLARQIEARARRDSGFAQVLDALLQAPTVPQGILEVVAARQLNEQRRAALLEDFIDGALPTPKVQALLGLRSPQAVHRLRTRGKVLGAAVGNQTWLPAWQFDDGRFPPCLPGLLELLTRCTSDPVAADRVLRITHDGLSDLPLA